MLPLRGTLRGRQSPGKAPAKPRQSPSGSWNSMLTVTLSPFASLRKPRVMMNPSMASSEHTGTVPQQIHIYIYNEFVKTFVSEFLASIGPLGQKVGTIGHQTTVL